jgi:hypothetical protein
MIVCHVFQKKIMIRRLSFYVSIYFHTCIVLNSIFEFMVGNATNMVHGVVLDLEKRTQILQWNMSTSLLVSSLFSTVLLLENTIQSN